MTTSNIYEQAERVRLCPFYKAAAILALMTTDPKADMAELQPDAAPVPLRCDESGCALFAGPGCGLVDGLYEIATCMPT